MVYDGQLGCSGGCGACLADGSLFGMGWGWGEGARGQYSLTLRLGPVLYSIFISHLFDLEDLSAFADDNYTIKVNKALLLLKSSLEASINNIS